MNRDTLYSGYVTDMSKGGEIVIPDIGDRYISVMIVLNDHYINQVFTGAGAFKINPDNGFGMIVVRTQVDSANPDDAKVVNVIQDKILVKMGSSAAFHPPQYDLKELEQWREKYMADGSSKPSLNGMQGPRGKVDPYMHKLGTAIGWG